VPRTLLSVALAAGLLVVIFVGLRFIRDPDAPGRLLGSIADFFGADGTADDLRALGPIPNKLIIAGIAVVVSVGGLWALLWATDDLVQRTGPRLRERLQPWVFVGPALVMLGVFLVYPVVRTIHTSLTEDGGAADNYEFAFTDPDMRIALRNNLLWLVFGTGGSVILGLLIATLVDKVRREALAKTFIFLPLAISFAGASVIWRFVYAWRPESEPQIGLLNAFTTSVFDSEPRAWLVEPPGNTYALITIMVWLQTGFAMVIFSAALKGVPSEIIEAARIDGANEFQLFFRVVLPSIRGAVITVSTTIFIAILKVFDIVFVMTGGRFDTEVIANRMYVEMFTFRNFGRASALAVVLLVITIPIMVLNVRNLRRQGLHR
jgi:alpha-glucoside transport system permease protein